MVRRSDQEYMEEALVEARRAVDIGEVPVGAVVVSPEGEILARGHNRRQIDSDPTGHAELLAIREAARLQGDWRLEGCTVYVTLEPCPMCAGTMIMSRIARCVYGCTDPKGGFLGTLGDLSHVPGINHHFEVTSGILAEESAELLRSFFRELRAKRRR
jgi:tRNA(adenine34) deaminase